MRHSLLAAMLLLSGCATAAPEAADEIAFTCADGRELRVAFTEDRARVTAPQGTFALAQQPSGSGFIYSDGPRTLRGKGDEVRWEFARMAPLVCQRVR